MHTSRKICALLLVFVLTFSVCTVPASAASKLDPTESVSSLILSKVYTGLEKMLFALLRGVDVLCPGEDSKWVKKENYVSENFYPGEERFAQQSDTARWSVGYGEGSLLDGLDVKNGEYLLAGSLGLDLMFTGRPVRTVADDQRVRAFAVSDGESGTAVFAVLDAFGLTRGDVQKIRAQFADYAQKHGVISVNVSVLHQHACIDTLGLGLKIIPALLNNLLVHALHLNDSRLIRLNVDFMENLYRQTVNAMQEAVDSMQTGTLYYGTADASDYIYDKRTPYVYDHNINRLRFVPDDPSAKETWICSAGIHCVALARENTLTADFPYYIEQEVKDSANLVYVQGAQLALTADKSKTNTPDMTAMEGVEAYGRRLGQLIKSIEKEEELEPVLNIASTEFFADVDNPIHIAAARQGILSSTVVHLPWHRYQLVTEVGYMELGGTLGVLLMPGELAPEILYGGAQTAQETWTGEDWNYAPLQETARCEKMICFGLCNDQMGYTQPDNEYRSMFTENEEVNILSHTSGSALVQAFEALIAAVK